MELAVNNDDEMPPMLEADGDIPLWHRSPVESPEPVAVMEVSFPLYLFFMVGWLVKVLTHGEHREEVEV